MKTALTCLLLFAAAPVQAYTYYYTGVTNTAQVAYESRARLRVDKHPTCLRGKCHALAWTALWDVGAGHSNQYVEVGIGYSPRFRCPKNASVALWWASPQMPAGQREACVPKGTEVVVTAQRVDGDARIRATWEWNGREVSRLIGTPDWITGPGIHPTKIEVYSFYDNEAPSPVAVFVSDVMLYVQDQEASLQQTAPYYAVPGSTLTNFSVVY